MSKITARFNKLIGSNFRVKRGQLLTELVAEIHAKRGNVRILDIGGTDLYWKVFPSSFFEHYNVSITVLNLPNNKDLKSDYGVFSFVSMDACEMGSISDNEFDIAHSNSVVEHVGDWVKMKKFASELKRVSHRHFVQTPSFWFPVEPHCMTLFFHWLPKPIRVGLVRHFALGYWRKGATIDDSVQIVESARLLNLGMFKELFPEGELIKERFIGITKSFISIK